jgi:hypothetical protein
VCLEPVCHYCGADRRCADCTNPAAPVRHVDGLGVCDRCALRRTLDRLLPEQTAEPLRRLRQAILAAEPVATRAWLNRPRTTSILADLHHGRVEFSHAALDALPAGRDLEHLRAVLVAAGALPTDPHRLLDRLADQLTDTIGGYGEPDRRVLHTWIRWRLLARLRRTADTGADLTGPIYHARATVGQVTDSSPTCTARAVLWRPANKLIWTSSSPRRRPPAATSARFSPGHSAAGIYLARCSYRPAGGEPWPPPPMPSSGGASPDDWCTTTARHR